jgi:hypothetical protein
MANDSAQVGEASRRASRCGARALHPTPAGSYQLGEDNGWTNGTDIGWTPTEPTWSYWATWSQHAAEAESPPHLRTNCCVCRHWSRRF